MTAVRPEHPYGRHAGADDLPAHGITGASGMAPRAPGITGASGMAPRAPGKVPAPQQNHAGQMTTMTRRSQPGLTGGAILGGSL